MAFYHYICRWLYSRPPKIISSIISQYCLSSPPIVMKNNARRLPTISSKLFTKFPVDSPNGTNFLNYTMTANQLKLPTIATSSPACLKSKQFNLRRLPPALKKVAIERTNAKTCYSVKPPVVPIKKYVSSIGPDKRVAQPLSDSDETPPESVRPWTPT